MATLVDPHIPVPLAPKNLMDARVEVSQQHICEEKLSAQFPGQTVCAVQYRKLVFKWFSSKTLENAELEHGNRWTVAAVFRGGENVDEKNVLEVALTDENDDEEEDEEEESEESEDSDKE
ncbi:hypothetical protein PT974_07015 [Cladobotryum mycophilum]|uniref:Uncharacterized protein n=1 Tax=Cladobotryum mycophilum TaxID=491253 RepID=A0ABR0SN20_9HYPO